MALEVDYWSWQSHSNRWFMAHITHKDDAARGPLIFTPLSFALLFQFLQQIKSATDSTSRF